MSPDNFVKVFDVLDAGYKDWWFPAFGLIFVVVGSVVAVLPRIIRTVGIPFLGGRSRWRAFTRYGMLGFGLFWTAITFLGTYSAHLRHKELLQDNRCSVVQGPIEHFVPMPSAGHTHESFSVSGVPFKYSDFAVTDAFNNTAPYGGPIKSESYVRICYDPSDNAILRLEIRDYAGPLKDYARAESFFPGLTRPPASEYPANRIAAPWYANVFIIVFIFDLIATWALILPYLRTFFPVKTLPLHDCNLPQSLEPGRKIKLRNSTIHWDRDRQAIWLRGRGLNFRPFMVAKLNVDASSRSITGSEFRISSGSLLATALVLVTAYVMFSVTMPANAPVSPGLFIGIAVLMVLIAGAVNLRILRSRMELLVQDALSELKDRSGPWSAGPRHALA